MKYTCDALLPKAERYVSPKFRRAHRMVLMDDGEQRELLAFVGVVGEPIAKLIFQWGPHAVGQFRRLTQDVVSLIEENWGTVTVEDCEAVWQATRDGGWKKGRLPHIVELMLYQRAHEGMSIPQMMEKYGLTRWQAQNGSRTTNAKAKAMATVSRSWAALGIG